MGIVMREDPRPLLGGGADERARWLARRTGLDATAIGERGVVERVSTGLLNTRDGVQPSAGEMLAVAAQWPRTPDVRGERAFLDPRLSPLLGHPVGFLTVDRKRAMTREFAVFSSGKVDREVPIPEGEGIGVVVQ